MGGKTLTRADLAEAVVQKVGLPRNESQELVELVLSEIASSRYPSEGSAHWAESQNRSGGADHSAKGAGVPDQQHHERAYQRRTDPPPQGRRVASVPNISPHVRSIEWL